jgi:putative phosphoribosyl transferase
MNMQAINIIEHPDLKNRMGVFRDRTDAGDFLARMMEGFRKTSAIVLAIPAGGIPVAARVAIQLELTLDVAVVSKITLPWNTEAGYGAVAFDESMLINDELTKRLNLSRRQIEEGIAETLLKVRRRIRLFRGDRPQPVISDRPAILVDDGLASGFTMRVAIQATRKLGASQVVVAVPTGHLTAVRQIAAEVNLIYCPNIRTGWSFAVADAYEHWSDVSEEDVLEQLTRLQTPKP